MSEIIPLVGPWASIYVGDTVSNQSGESPNTNPLIKILDTRTKGSQLIYKAEGEWIPFLGNEVITGTRIDFSLTFYDSNYQTQCLEMGNSIDPNVTSSPDNPTTRNVYTLVLLDYLGSYCVWIPWCITEKKFNLNKTKQARPDTTIHFYYEEPDASVQLYRTGTYSEILSLISPRILQTN